MDFVFRRIGYAALVVLGVVVFVFFLTRLSGDPVVLMAGDFATQEQIDALRAELGFDAPLLVQLGRYLWNALRGDFGTSLQFAHTPAMQLVLERLRATLGLAAVSQLLAILVAVPVGVLSAVRRNSFADFISRNLAVAGQCMPLFWSGILLIQLFSVKYGVLPSYGAGSWQHLILPSITLATYSIPHTMRILRSSLLETLHLDYVRTARAKGLRENAIVLKHALRNAIIPALTVFGLRLGVVLGGAIVTEKVFAYPGLGQLALQAISTRDYPVIQAFVVCSALIIVILNVLVDIAYSLLDPRIRLSESGR